MKRLYVCEDIVNWLLNVNKAKRQGRFDEYERTWIRFDLLRLNENESVLHNNSIQYLPRRRGAAARSGTAEDGSRILGPKDPRRTKPFPRKFDETEPNWKLFVKLVKEGNYATSKEYSNLPMAAAKKLCADFISRVESGTHAGASVKSIYDITKAYKYFANRTMFIAVVNANKGAFNRTSEIMAAAAARLIPSEVRVLAKRPNVVVDAARAEGQAQVAVVPPNPPPGHAAGEGGSASGGGEAVAVGGGGQAAGVSDMDGVEMEGGMEQQVSMEIDGSDNIIYPYDKICMTCGYLTVKAVLSVWT